MQLILSRKDTRKHKRIILRTVIHELRHGSVYWLLLQIGRKDCLCNEGSHKNSLQEKLGTELRLCVNPLKISIQSSYSVQNKRKTPSNSGCVDFSKSRVVIYSSKFLLLFGTERNFNLTASILTNSDAWWLSYFESLQTVEATLEALMDCANWFLQTAVKYTVIWFS